MLMLRKLLQCWVQSVVAVMTRDAPDVLCPSDDFALMQCALTAARIPS